MKRWLKIIAVIGCCTWAVGLAVATETTSTERLLFEQVGPTDGSIQPFFIEVGRITETTRDVIFVTPETYESVFALVKRASFSPPQNPKPMVTFQVTSFRDGEPNKFYTIYPEAMFSVIKRLQTMFQSEHHQMPEFLMALETLLAAPK